MKYLGSQLMISSKCVFSFDINTKDIIILIRITKLSVWITVGCQVGSFETCFLFPLNLVANKHNISSSPLTLLPYLFVRVNNPLNVRPLKLRIELSCCLTYLFAQSVQMFELFVYSKIGSARSTVSFPSKGEGRFELEPGHFLGC